MTDFLGYLDHRDAFKELLDPQRYSIEWLDGQVWAGFIQCWSNERACILAKINHYPTGAFDIHGMAAAGELESIKPLIEQAEQWARSMGALSAEIASRPGWERALKEAGYEPHQRVLRKDL